MRANLGGWAALIVCLAAATCLAAEPKPRVTLEVVTKAGAPLTAAQQWHKILSEAGVASVQIRQMRSGDEMGISAEGTKAAPQFRVLGIVAADNALYLPGGKFGVHDAARLRKWFDTLSDVGPEGVTTKPSAFGLTPSQLAEAHDDLKTIVTTSTLGTPAGKAVEQIGRRLKYRLELDAGAQRELAAVKVAAELQGLSSGTALAAILRPAGLVLVPERPPGGPLRYRLGRPGRGESWPVGWKAKGLPNKIVPELYEFLNVEISDTPVSEALAALQARLKVPFLFDYNALAQHGIDPAEVKAAVPSKRLSYSQILNKVLASARLRYELRTDEADQPLVWITTVKPVR